MIGPDIAALAKSLFERRREGVSVKRVALQGGDWQPVMNQCHVNVARWIRWHREHKALRGWWCADYLDATPRFYEFFPHSVIETETGELIDFTPNPLPWRYPFIRHNGTDDEFAELVEDKEITKLIYQLKPGDDP